ncbi:hypothetical protein HDU97_001403 [Phlyctochytrium planicorne]|nr:hypothetical protein HDU97_001403 [Phlyctochytrium planicorne]
MQQPQQVVMAVNAAEMCAAGGIHSISDEFTCCGITLAILCFPIGLVCCFLMREKKCIKCGTTF